MRFVHVSENVVDLRQRMRTENRSSTEFRPDGSRPTREGIEVRQLGLGARDRHHVGCVMTHVGQRDGPGAHESAIAGGPPPGAMDLGRGVVTIFVRQRSGRGGATVGGPRTPGAETCPHVIEIECTVGQQRFGQGQHHLAVVGEFARGPVERTAADHLGGGAHEGDGEARREGVRWAEFERCSQGVADAGSDESSDAALLRVGADVVVGGVEVCVVHGPLNDVNRPKCVLSPARDDRFITLSVTIIK